MLSGLTTCSSQAVDLVKKMLVFDPSKRITVSQMLVLTQLALSLLFNAE
jgi:serine/threonine protein kinase